jgi:hypothetical protein
MKKSLSVKAHVLIFVTLLALNLWNCKPEKTGGYDYQMTYVIYYDDMNDTIKLFAKDELFYGSNGTLNYIRVGNKHNNNCDVVSTSFPIKVLSQEYKPY